MGAFYYDIALPITTNGVAATISSAPHLTMVVQGNQPSAIIKGCYAGARGSAAGGGTIRAQTAGTATSSTGGAVTPAARNPNNPAALTSALSSQTTASATPTTRFSVGFAQTGGMGGWVAIEPAAAIELISTGAKSTGGATQKGNCDFNSIANAASQLVDLTVEFSE